MLFLALRKGEATADFRGNPCPYKVVKLAPHRELIFHSHAARRTGTAIRFRQRLVKREEQASRDNQS